ncbi:MAG: Na/Pi cotransporter family protein [Acutalibacteraceae bacterium]|nr:Na/Pi cotransporter family protein [Acutalibacteraceae bacterium]
MTIFDVLTLIGGLCLFLFGMNVMGDSLERRAGSGLKTILGKLTKNKAAGFFTGLGVTAIIQSSSATTVMVVGFVNSGLMTLQQSISVIMGANVGTTVTAWILSLCGIESSNIFISLLKPSSFTPFLALIGLIMQMFGKTSKKKDTGSILLGFATLMFGMETMSGAVEGLAEVEAFRELFVMFKNPILGVIVGAILTAIIQSSSASVGILQALSVTGQVTNGAAVPILMGQHIGTCVTALISSAGANKNAKRAAMVHLLFNVIGTVVWLTVFSILSSIFTPAFLDESASYFGIAVMHTIISLLRTVLLLPMSSLLEKLAIKLVPDSKKEEEEQKLDERLLATPAIALKSCESLVNEMAQMSVEAMNSSLKMLVSYDSKTANKIREIEDKADRYEDILGSYLVKLSQHQMSDDDSEEVSKLLKVIGDFERISDHAINIVESAEELKDKQIVFTESAMKELEVISHAINEILDLSYTCFINNDIDLAYNVEPLEQVIDKLKDKMRNGHINRLKNNECTIEAGFVWADIITNLERTSDHCSNIAVCVIDSKMHNMNIHESIYDIKHAENFKTLYRQYKEKYTI